MFYQTCLKIRWGQTAYLRTALTDGCKAMHQVWGEHLSGTLLINPGADALPPPIVFIGGIRGAYQVQKLEHM